MAAFAMAFAVFPRTAWAQSEQVTLSIPTTVPCAVMADGSVVAPSDWEISSEIDAPATLESVEITGAPKGLSMKASIDGQTLLEYENGMANASSAAALAGRSSVKVDWEFGRLDVKECAEILEGSTASAAVLCTVSMTFTAEPVAFAVYSEDDGSLDFYKRTSIPEVGSVFEGKTVSEVYTGLEAFKANARVQVPWYEIRALVSNVSVIDEGISPAWMSYWFDNFTNLSSIDLDKLDVSSTRSFYDLFTGCDALESVDLTAWHPEQLQNVDYAFTGCDNLEEIEGLENWDVSRCSTLRGTFSYLKSMAEIHGIEGWDVSNVENMSRLFHGSSLLSGIACVEAWHTPKLKNLDNTFLDCSGLAHLDLSSWNLSGVDSAADAFTGCLRLSRITVNETIRWMEGGFLPEPSASYIDGADGKWYDAATGAGYAPEGVPSEKAATYVSKDPKTAFAVFSADDGSLNFYKRLEAPEAGTMFEGKSATAVYADIENLRCTIANTPDNSWSNLETTTPWFGLRESVKSSEAVDEDIAPASIDFWFARMDDLESVDLSKMDGAGLSRLFGVFALCPSLGSASLPHDIQGVTNLSNTFYKCASLSAINLSGLTTGPQRYFWATFDDCTELALLDLPAQNLSAIPYWAFCNCPRLAYDCSDWTVANQTPDGKGIALGSPGVTIPASWTVATSTADDGHAAAFAAEDSTSSEGFGKKEEAASKSLPASSSARGEDDAAEDGKAAA